MNSRIFKSTMTIVPIIAIIIFIWIYFSPGYMSSDSFVQYGSALAGVYPDNHPAIMSILWHYLMYLIPGPQSLLIFHCFLLAGGIYFWQRNANWYAASLMLVLSFMAPWIINFAGVLWKDVGMAFAMLFGSALLLNNKKNKKMALASIPFLLYAFAVRYNSILAIIPLVFIGLFYLYPCKPYWKTGLLTVCVVVLSFFLIKFVTYNVIHAQKKNYEVLLMGDDIAKISSETHQKILQDIKDEDLKSCTAPPILYERALCFISKGYDKNGILVVGMPVEDVHKLWFKTIMDHPFIYARIKIDAFLYFLRSPYMAPVTSWLPGVNKNLFGIVASNPQGVISLESYVMGAQKSIWGEFFKPYLWLIITLFMLPLSLLIKSPAAKLQILALNLSSLGCFTSLLLSVPSVDFRYSYWCIISVTVSIIIWISACINGRRP